MSNVLTVASTTQCGHAGTITVVSSALLTVANNPVLIYDSVFGKPVAGCTTPASTGTKPCTAVLSILPVSQATKLIVGGQPVLLDTLVGTTDGVPPGTLLAIAGQAKLSAQ